MDNRPFRIELGTRIDLPQFADALRQILGPATDPLAQDDAYPTQDVLDPIRAILDVVEVGLELDDARDVVVSMRLQRTNPLTVIVELAG